MEGAKKILVVRLSSLGDILLCMPAVKALKQATAYHVSWLVEHPSLSQFLAFQGVADEVMVFPRRAIEVSVKKGLVIQGLSTIAHFIKDLRLSRFDLVLDLHGCLKSALLTLFSKAERRIGLGKNFSKELAHLFYREKVEGERRLHKVERNMLFLRYLGFDGPVPEIQILVPAESEESVETFLRQAGLKRPPIVVNPFSSKKGSFKRWPMEAYGHLIRGLREELKRDVVLIFGPEEKKDAELFHKRMNGTFILPPLFDLFELAALLKRSALYIGGDTGITHLAAFCTIPVLSLFGPTDHLVNGPYSRKALILRKEVACSPCKKRDCKARECLHSISPSEVLSSAKVMLDTGL